MTSIPMCCWYSTTCWPYFRPVCLKGRQAGLKCHSERKSCPDYKPVKEEARP